MTEAEALHESAQVAAEITKSAEELGTYQNWCHENIHVYEVAEDMWIAAEGPEAAVLYYLNECGGDEDEPDEFGDPVLLTPEMMATTAFIDEERPDITTFQAALDDLFYCGGSFPTLFATIL